MDGLFRRVRWIALQGSSSSCGSASKDSTPWLDAGIETPPVHGGKLERSRRYTSTGCTGSAVCKTSV
eukprot:6464408-Amphidinium_carterae.1